MNLQVGSVVLLLCCLGVVLVHTQRTSGPGEGGGSDRPKSIWDPPIQFSSKAGDMCSLLVTGQGDTTLLRVSCRGKGRTYWCEYIGRPHTCRSYSNDPRHYFVQMMWGFRKLQNACRAPSVIKPHMCKRAPDDAQMVLSVSPYSRAESTRASIVQHRPAESTRTGVVQHRPAESRTTGVHKKTHQRSSGPRPGRRGRPGPPTTERAGPPATETATPMPSTTVPTTPRKREQLARDYCWRSLQGVCSYVIGWFHQ